VQLLKQDLVTVKPAGTIKITTFFEDGSTQILTTIQLYLPFGRIKYVLSIHYDNQTYTVLNT
jgi:hypothetical protein